MAAKHHNIEPFPKRITEVHPDLFPAEYAMQVEGDCLAPYFETGDKLIFDKNARLTSDDFVAVFFVPGIVWESGHSVIVKRLVIDLRGGGDVTLGGREKGIMVECFNPPRIFQIPSSKIAGVHKCTGKVSESTRLYKISDEELLAAAGPPASRPRVMKASAI